MASHPDAAVDEKDTKFASASGSASKPDTATDASTAPPATGLEKKVQVQTAADSDSLAGPAAPLEKKRGWFGKKRKKSAEGDEEKAAVVAAAPEAPAQVSMASLFRFSKKHELLLNFIGLVAAVAAGAGSPVMSIIFGNLSEAFINFGTAVQNFDSGSVSSSDIESAAAQFRQKADEDAAILVYIGLGMLVVTFIYMHTWAYTGEATSKRIRENYLRAILRQDIAFFDDVGAGEVATRIQTDTHLIQQGISEKVAFVAQFSGAFVSGYIVAYVRSWRLALALTSALPCIVISGAVINIFASKYMQQTLKHGAEGGSVAEEVISTIRTAQAFGTQNILSQIYDTHVQNSHSVETKMALVSGLGMSFFFFANYATYALAFNFGTTLVIHGHASVGVVISVFMSILIGTFSIVMLAPELQAVVQARGAAAKLWATIDRVPSIDSDNTSGLKPEKVVGEIHLENVDFNYPSRPDVPVVQNLTLHFPAGKTAALVGASGSGKSTIVALVERFYDPLKGRVLLDGVDLKELNVKWLRGQIGFVAQEPVLFSMTIKANVAHGLIGSKFEHAPEEEKFALIKEACIKANADSFISKLPMGYDTLVGERGFLLSGGQKQRVAIARAIVSDPRILLLDEATSALDTQSEGVVQDALDKASAGRTTITIAHRLSTIKNADNIYVMGEGKVLENGTHDGLIAQPNSHYSRLVEAQRLREAEETEQMEAGPADEAKYEKMLVKASSVHGSSKEALDDTPLGRKQSGLSQASDLVKTPKSKEEKEEDFSIIYIFKRFGVLQTNVWKNYSIGSLFAIMNGMIYPAFGIVYAISITAFQNASDPHLLRHEGDRNALWLFIIAILAMITIAVQNYEFSSAAANLTSKLRSLSFKAIMRQDIEFFDDEKNSTGSLTANLSGNPQKVNGLVGSTLGAIVQAIATVIGAAVIGLAYQWKVALVGIACMPFLVSVGFIHLQVVVLKDQKNKRAHEESAQLACEAAGAIRTVASLTREKECIDIYSESLRVPLQLSNRAAFWSSFIYAVSQGLVFFSIALVFWFGSRGISRLEFGTIAFFVCLFSVTFGFIQGGSVFAFVPDISSAKGAGSAIIRLLDSRPEIDAQSTEGAVLKDTQGHIRFENVHFRYPTRPGVRVLRGLDLEVKPGTYIALVGESGCGKSTTIQLIERFYDPISGKVTIDGQDISGLNVQEYRKHIALVSQEPTLYAGTVKFNVLLGATKPHSEVTQEEIEDACRDANILDFIRSLPEGFDTNVGGKGSQLSGGQKQRIAIARALLRNPKVLLLDEATSALDSNSEKVVQEALDKAAKGRTTIAIAHRLSTIQNADCIYFIKDGRVSEAGTHDQLLALKGGYYEYVQLQGLSTK